MDVSPAPPSWKAWWEDRRIAIAAVLLAALPLLWPDIPPLVDFPGHLGRYRVQIGIDESPFLARYYSFDWALIGNLGLDLLIIPLSKLFGLELAGKLLAISIPVLMTGGMLAVAREIHGRVPSTAFFALPLAYAWPFHFGFVNSCFSVALAFCAFALWLRLGRTRLRVALFVVIGALVWLAHVVGWGVLGILCFSAELLAPERKGERLHRRLGGAIAQCLPLTLPFLAMLAWRSGDVKGVNYDMFNWEAKWLWLTSILREQDESWDLFGAAVIAPAIVLGWLRGPRGVEPRMALAGLTLSAVFVLMPRIVFGSNYADMRLVPVGAAMLLLAVRPYRSPRWGQLVAITGLAFFAARIAGTTVLFWTFDRAYDRQLAALDHVPKGARVLSLVGMRCGENWRSTRLEHLPSLAIVRRDAFTNDQWVLPGAQLLDIRYQAAAPYTHDPSQMAPFPYPCRREPQVPLPVTLARFPKAAFDYLWLMNLPRDTWPKRGDLIEVYRNSNGVLYRIAR